MTTNFILKYFNQEKLKNGYSYGVTEEIAQSSNISHIHALAPTIQKTYSLP